MSSSTEIFNPDCTINTNLSLETVQSLYEFYNNSIPDEIIVQNSKIYASLKKALDSIIRYSSGDYARREGSNELQLRRIKTELTVDLNAILSDTLFLSSFDRLFIGRSDIGIFDISENVTVQNRVKNVKMLYVLHMHCSGYLDDPDNVEFLQVNSLNTSNIAMIAPSTCRPANNGQLIAIYLFKLNKNIGNKIKDRDIDGVISELRQINHTLSNIIKWMNIWVNGLLNTNVLIYRKSHSLNASGYITNSKPFQELTIDLSRSRDKFGLFVDMIRTQFVLDYCVYTTSYIEKIQHDELNDLQNMVITMIHKKINQ